MVVSAEHQNMTTRTCKDCVHFRPYRDPDTKRIHPSKKGACGWHHGIEHWPMSIVGTVGHEPWIGRNRVFDTTNASKCKCFELKPGAAPKTSEQLEIGGVE